METPETLISQFVKTYRRKIKWAELNWRHIKSANKTVFISLHLIYFFSEFHYKGKYHYINPLSLKSDQHQISPRNISEL